MTFSLHLLCASMSLYLSIFSYLSFYHLISFSSDEDDSPLLVGVKMTGDTYVPAGEKTFQAELNSPIHPTQAQMQSMNSLRLVKLCQNLDCMCPKVFPRQVNVFKTLMQIFNNLKRPYVLTEVKL